MFFYFLSICSGCPFTSLLVDCIIIIIIIIIILIKLLLHFKQKSHPNLT